jgi:hypothetical protein
MLAWNEASILITRRRFLERVEYWPPDGQMLLNRSEALSGADHNLSAEGARVEAIVQGTSRRTGYWRPVFPFAP